MDRPRRSFLLSALGLLPAARLLRAQQTDQSSTFSTDVKVVNVFATVRDKDNRVVRNLTKDDFNLLEDGRPQSIRYFSQQSDLPLTLGLLVDTSGSERRMLGTERQASYSFLEQVLRPEKDKAFLIHFDREVELLQDLTSSRERLEKALALLDTTSDTSGNQAPSGGGNGGGGGWPGGGGGWPGGGGGWPGGGGGRHGGGRSGGHRGGGTAFYDAIYLAADDLMKKQSGRKALIMLTDGEDNASKVSLSEAISSSEHADTLAYSIRIADSESNFSRGFGSPGMGGRGGWGGGGGRPGRGGGTGRPDGKKILQQISKETGGGYFEVSKKKSVDDIYSQIEEELRNQYSIGYTSDQAGGDGAFRKISLTVKEKGLIVQAREGYYARTQAASS
jgi:VWFA-related protein